MPMKKKWITCMLLAMAAAGVQAQNPKEILRQTRENGWEFDLKAGINIGGFSPLPLPVEIRSIDSYNPTLAVQLGLDITKWIDDSRIWGITSGLRFENKNMTTRATVKNYGMEIWRRRQPDERKLDGRSTHQGTEHLPDPTGTGQLESITTLESACRSILLVPAGRNFLRRCL